MKSQNIYELIEQFQSDGFTIDNLSSITGVSSELINRCASRDRLTHDDTIVLGKVLSFLGSLYMVDTNNALYLKDGIDALEQSYKLPRHAIASYLGLKTDEFEKFLELPENYPNSNKLLLRLMHLSKIILIQKSN